MESAHQSLGTFEDGQVIRTHKLVERFLGQAVWFCGGYCGQGGKKVTGDAHGLDLFYVGARGVTDGIQQRLCGLRVGKQVGRLVVADMAKQTKKRAVVTVKQGHPPAKLCLQVRKALQLRAEAGRFLGRRRNRCNFLRGVKTGNMGRYDEPVIAHDFEHVPVVGVEKSCLQIGRAPGGQMLGAEMHPRGNGRAVDGVAVYGCQKSLMAVHGGYVYQLRPPHAW